MTVQLQGIDSFDVLPQLLSEQWEGTFLMEPGKASLLMQAASQLTLADIDARIEKQKARQERIRAGEVQGSEVLPYVVSGNIAQITLQGPITKSGSSFDPLGSSVNTKHNLRKALADPQVKGVWMNICSPGGAWAGTTELNHAVAALSSVKPVFVAGEEIVASGGYLAATSASQIWLNDPGVVGSIGVYSTILDKSALYDKAGLKVHVLRFGADKGIGIEGVPISDEQLAVLQQRVDEIGGMFIEQVSAGRRRTPAQVAHWATGRTYAARDGLKMGLIDVIGTPEEAMAALVDRVNGKVSRQVQGVKAMNYSEIVAACRGLNPSVAADAVFLAKLQQQSNLTAESVKEAWSDEKERRADIRVQEAEAKVAASRKDADAQIAAAQAKQSDEQLQDEIAPGGKKAPQGQKWAGAVQTSGAHPFTVAVRDLMAELQLTQSEATIQVIRDNPELHQQFVMDHNPKTAKQWDYRTADSVA